MKNIEQKDSVAVEVKKRHKLMNHLRKHSLVYTFLVPVLIHFLIFFLIPIGFSFVMTFLNYKIVGPAEFAGLDNWARFFKDPLAWKSIWNTLKFSFFYIVPTMALGMTFAVLIHSMRRSVGTFFKGIFFLPVVTSFIVISGIWKWMFRGTSEGLINQFLALFGIETQLFLSSSSQALIVLAGLSIFKVVGNTMIYYYAGLQGIPDDVYEAAKVDGAGRLRTFWTITMPMMLPIHFYVALTTTIGSFQIFDSAYLLTNGGPNYSTNTLVFYLYQQGFTNFNFGYASVLAYVLFFAILVISLIQNKVLGKDLNK